MLFELVNNARICDRRNGNELKNAAPKDEVSKHFKWLYKVTKCCYTSGSTEYGLTSYHIHGLLANLTQLGMANPMRARCQLDHIVPENAMENKSDPVPPATPNLEIASINSPKSTVQGVASLLV